MIDAKGRGMDWLLAFIGVYRGAEAYRQVHGGQQSWDTIDGLKRAALMREALRSAAQRQYEGDRSDHAVSAEAFAQSRPMYWPDRRTT
jgi:hypothetical protein